MSELARPRPVKSGSPRGGAPLPVAALCALAWLAITVAVFGVGGPALVALGVAGSGLIVGLLALTHRQRMRLHALATTDPLTGLANHRGFQTRLAESLAASEREGMPVALVILDLDDFMAINDAHGHPYGDGVLRAVADRLAGAVRAGDVAARIGGEEFGLILHGVEDDRALAVAERARAAVAAVPVTGFELGCSAGLATCPGDSDDASVLCHLAETALHWAKRGGKGRTRRFDTGHTPADWSERQRAEVEAMLASEGSIEIVFQPFVALATGRIIGYEALARFPSTARSSPEGWFAQAHGCGLGAELEAAAITAALAQDGRPLGTHLALNVSPSALSSRAVYDALPADLSEIVIEVTEHELVPDDDELAAVIADLRGRGARVALDDAGAGYAGLKQLMRVKPDIVKLDRELLDGIHDDEARTALVESFVQFARHSGATVCAEGIESLDDLAAVADLDVQWGQGYVFAHPALPWSGISPLAAEVCRAAFDEALHAIPAAPVSVAAGDRRLVHLSTRLADARSRDDLRSALPMIAAELGADELTLSRWHPEVGLIETVAESGKPWRQGEFASADFPLTSRVLDDHQAVQVFVSDPFGDPAETKLLLDLGARALLMVPVINRGRSLGLLEAYSHEDRPWTRAEINRARVLANQLGAVLEAVLEPAPQG